MKYDYLIVGSGLAGSTFAYFAKKNKKRCLVIDKRKHPGGNLYCEEIFGINVHTYGPHIFHTSNKEVWDFVNSLVPFDNFINCPLANYKGKLYNLPFNMNTFYQMWGCKTPEEAHRIIEKQKKNQKIINPKNLEEQAISLVGEDVYRILIKEYTEKQWGRNCKDLPPSIIRRLPVRFTYNNNYFNDNYQGIPAGGYNNLIQKLLEGVDLLLDEDYFKNREHWNNLANEIIFTGQIDEYFNFQFGKLDYRTVRFESEMLEISNYQGNAVINYTSHDKPYTRIIEHKHFQSNNSDIDKTVITKEYSTEWNNYSEPFYPINDDGNSKLYNKYSKLANNEKNVRFIGRLAEYKYYDMDDIIEKIMGLSI